MTSHQLQEVLFRLGACEEWRNHILGKDLSQVVTYMRTISPQTKPHNPNAGTVLDASEWLWSYLFGDDFRQAGRMTQPLYRLFWSMSPEMLEEALKAQQEEERRPVHAKTSRCYRWAWRRG